MATPIIAASATDTEGSNVTSHDLTLPSGIVSGNLLLAAAASRKQSTHTWQAGWTEFFDELFNSANDVSLSLAWRKADGGEGATVNVVTTKSTRVSSVTHRITGAADPTSQPPEVSSVVKATSTAPDPAILTPTGGSKTYLWIPVIAIEDNDTINSAPTNYANILESAGGQSHIGSCDRALTAASEDAGAWAITTSLGWIAAIIAVHPAAAAGWTGTIAGVANPAKVDGIAVANIAKINAVA